MVDSAIGKEQFMKDIGDISVIPIRENNKTLS